MLDPDVLTPLRTGEEMTAPSPLSQETGFSGIRKDQFGSHTVLI